MKKIRAAEMFTLILFATLAAHAQAPADDTAIRPEGQRLANALDHMDVEHLWLSGQAVRWRTGEPLGQPATDGRGHTHCSAFVAAAAAELGIYILRPPQHSSTLLANAQYDWLAGDGSKEGWVPIGTALRAQHLANSGQLVVAVYKESDPKKPGHIAIVRPSEKDETKIKDEGPQIIQAGRNNHDSTTLKEGFKHHHGAFAEGKIRFYAHPMPETSKAFEKKSEIRR